MSKKITQLKSGIYEYKSAEATYHVTIKSRNIGGDKLLGNLTITSKEHPNRRKRFPVDLMDDIQLEKKCEAVEGALGIKAENLVSDISLMTHQLEDELRKGFDKKNPEDFVRDKKSGEAILKQKDFLEVVNKILGFKVAGEEKNRLLLFLIMISYKYLKPIHGIIQARSSSGKSYLIESVASLLPIEDVISLLVMTKSAIPNMTQNELMNKCLIFEDLAMMGKPELLHLGEMQTKQIIGVSKVHPQLGRTVMSKVNTHVSTVSASTTDNIKIDNKNRSFIIKLDESQKQTNIINKFNAKLASGEIDTREFEAIQSQIQDAIRLLKPHSVVNPFASKVVIPNDCQDHRRLQEIFLRLVEVIVFVNQYNRNKDEQGRLITTIEDVKLAVELTADIFITKADTLSTVNREFLEELKIYLNSLVEADKEITDVVFRADELFNVISGGISSIYRKIDNLIKIGLIRQTGGNRKTGQKLRLAYNDEYEALVERIHDQLNEFSNENLKPEAI